MSASPTTSTSGRSSSPPSDSLAKLRIQRAAPPARGSWFTWFLKLVICLAVIGAMAVGGVLFAIRSGWLPDSNKWFTIPEAIQNRPEVRLATVTVESGRSADATVVATGYLESRWQAKIGARAPGRIEVIHVEEGTRVEKDQILAVLEHADLDASVAAVEATLARAKAELLEQDVVIEQTKRESDRAENLKGSRSISESAYDEAKFKHRSAVARRASLDAAIALASARLSEAQQMQKNMFIRAPFGGTVISKDAEVGESILPGGMGEASGRGSVVTVADLNRLDVDCDVKEDYISRVIVDHPAEVAVDAVPGRRYQGRVRKVIPMGDRAKATIRVKVEITNVDERLFPDMSATVYFLPVATAETAEKAQRRVFCDNAAIQTGESGSFVWLLDEERRVKRVDVKTGLVRDSRTEITSGLSGSEQVVIAPPGTRAGQLVKIAP
jgi:RND family efflux transporter MFP subunit